MRKIDVGVVDPLRQLCAVHGFHLAFNRGRPSQPSSIPVPVTVSTGAASISIACAVSGGLARLPLLPVRNGCHGVVIGHGQRAQGGKAGETARRQILGDAVVAAGLHCLDVLYLIVADVGEHVVQGAAQATTTHISNATVLVLTSPHRLDIVFFIVVYDGNPTICFGEHASAPTSVVAALLVP